MLREVDKRQNELLSQISLSQTEVCLEFYLIEFMPNFVVPFRHGVLRSAIDGRAKHQEHGPNTHTLQFVTSQARGHRAREMADHHTSILFPRYWVSNLLTFWGKYPHKKFHYKKNPLFLFSLRATAEITLQVLVFDEAICGVQGGDGAELNSIVIVHLTGGRDYFIVIDAKYQKGPVVKDLISFDD